MIQLNKSINRKRGIFVSLQEFLIDVKNILFGRVDIENGENFKEELEAMLKAGKISKADAALLIQSVNTVKADAAELEKRQLSSISLEDGSVVSIEEHEKKKKELERKKREKELQQRAAVQNTNSQNISKEVKENKVVNNEKKLKIDRTKIAEVMKNDERTEKIAEQNLNKTERDGKN